MSLIFKCFCFDVFSDFSYLCFMKWVFHSCFEIKLKVARILTYGVWLDFRDRWQDLAEEAHSGKSNLGSMNKGWVKRCSREGIDCWRWSVSWVCQQKIFGFRWKKREERWEGWQWRWDDKIFFVKIIER